MPQKILVFTGGGTAGHVIPNLALVPALREKGWVLHYLGSANGPEKALVEEAGLAFHSIATGKFRRYFSVKNFTDPFRVLWGVCQAYGHLRTLRPQVVFSKGGFVGVPVVYAATLLRVPVILHESDLTPGLANKLCLPWARRICASFPETLPHLPKDKAVLTGTPIREELIQGDGESGLRFLGFKKEKPVLLMMGGSMGAAALNQIIRSSLGILLERWQVVHLCGSGKNDPAFEGKAGYRQFEFLGKELPGVFACANLVVSRAGANSLFELLALRKPMLLIPLPTTGSRGDQILNAESFLRRGLAHVLRQEDLTPQSLLKNLEELSRDAENLKRKMEASDLAQGTDRVVEVIETFG